MTGNVGKNSKLMSMPGGILISATGLLLIPPGEGDPASDCGQKTFSFLPFVFHMRGFFPCCKFSPPEEYWYWSELPYIYIYIYIYIYGIGGLLMGDLVYNKKASILRKGVIGNYTNNWNTQHPWYV